MTIIVSDSAPKSTNVIWYDTKEKVNKVFSNFKWTNLDSEETEEYSPSMKKITFSNLESYILQTASGILSLIKTPDGIPLDEIEDDHIIPLLDEVYAYTDGKAKVNCILDDWCFIDSDYLLNLNSGKVKIAYKGTLYDKNDKKTYPIEDVIDTGCYWENEIGVDVYNRDASAGRICNWLEKTGKVTFDISTSLLELYNIEYFEIPFNVYESPKNLFENNAFRYINTFLSDISGDVSGMFKDSLLLERIKLTYLSSTNVTSLFENCIYLKSVGIYGDVSNVPANSMFYECYNLKEIYLDGSITFASTVDMFKECYSLLIIKLPEECFTASVSFEDCIQLTAESVSNIFNALSNDVTATLTLSEQMKLYVTDEMIDAATDKGWTVIFV